MQKQSFYQWIQLIGLKIKMTAQSFSNYCHVIVKYYRHLAFLKVDSTLLFFYLFRNPFKISRRYLEEKGAEEIYAYGETPLTTMDLIATEVGVKPADALFELGCGRGRTCFWLHLMKGCRVVGIDYVPEFIHNANRVKKRFNLTRIDFRKEDFLESSLDGATIIYLYGTCLPDETIVGMMEKFRQLPIGTKIVTVSYPLDEYENLNENQQVVFRLIKAFKGRFEWGEAEVFVQQVMKK